ncbi:uncharacterized protein LOC135074708 isoform X3 [Ostrinia nubilalis]|uniref:uncharacterized protein LOC135074708 isoform X3 n=1 Tax=Ostrinia nubilalis TaxID=29057 RepID=UPI0030825B78
MSKLTELKRKRSSYKSKLTQFKTYFSRISTCEKPNPVKISDLNLRLAKIEEWYSEYDALQIEIESCLEISDVDCEKEYKYREELESEYFAVVGSAREWMDLEETTRICALPRYRRAQILTQHFWNRYYMEYISDLQKRLKWKRSNGGELRTGDLVVVKDDRLPPNRWLLGRVTRLYPGCDGIARVADVTTATGVLRRAYNRLCLLPTEDILELDVPTRGTC